MITITPSELLEHQLSYYKMLLAESKCDKQKRYLRSELYRLKRVHSQ